MKNIIILAATLAISSTAFAETTREENEILDVLKPIYSQTIKAGIPLKAINVVRNPTRGESPMGMEYDGDTKSCTLNISVRNNPAYTFVMNSTIHTGNAVKIRVLLAHEIGHCEQNSTIGQDAVTTLGVHDAEVYADQYAIRFIATYYPSDLEQAVNYLADFRQRVGAASTVNDHTTAEEVEAMKATFKF
jgi:hypothetical protein